MNRTITFSCLRQILFDLGFSQASDSGSGLVFEHAPSGTLLFCRVYKLGDTIDLADLAKTRRFLDERGVMAADEFDEIVHKTRV